MYLVSLLSSLVGFKGLNAIWQVQNSKLMWVVWNVNKVILYQV